VLAECFRLQVCLRFAGAEDNAITSQVQHDTVIVASSGSELMTSYHVTPAVMSQPITITQPPTVTRSLNVTDSVGRSTDSTTDSVTSGVSVSSVRAAGLVYTSHYKITRPDPRPLQRARLTNLSLLTTGIRMLNHCQEWDN